VDARPEGAAAEARIHVSAAVAYFERADYAGAVRELETAYRLHRAPDIQFNLGECYARLGRTDEAIAAYRAYLADRPAAEDRAQVAARIADLERALAAARGGSAPPTVVEKVVWRTVVIYRAPPPPPGRGARWAAWGVAALSLGSLAAAITTTALAAQATSQIEHGGDPAMPPIYDGKLEQRAHIEWILGASGFALGGVAAAGAVALFLLARRIDREAPPVTLAPARIGDGGGLAAWGSF
jgi:tetratricopeptide (TPR) repeat protein